MLVCVNDTYVGRLQVVTYMPRMMGDPLWSQVLKTFRTQSAQ